MTGPVILAIAVSFDVFEAIFFDTVAAARVM